MSRRSRVIVREPTDADADAYIAHMRAGRAFHRPWISAPTDREAWDRLMARHATPEVEVLFAVRREDDEVVGTFVLSQIFYGPLCNAYLGYWATQAYAGRGYMSEGMAGVLRHAFRTLRLHRVEANVQPGNAASIALLERTGFRREGFSPRYLKVAGRWRDHERWAMTVEDWRSPKRRVDDLAS
jgi:[ribosomal protein S5]-alanine N-acetyltransferase